MQAFTLREDYSKQKEFNYFFCSDIHFGNPGQDKKLLKKEFDEAKSKNAKIFIGGDWGDFIMAGDHKRYHPSQDVYGTDNNVNMTIDEAYEFFSDYVDNIVMISTGNHEVSVSKFHHFDPTQQLIWSLNTKKNAKIVHGQYTGYIVIYFTRGKNGMTRKYKIYYNHGQGGTAEVSKGTIDLNRHMTTKIADMYWLQHKHVKTVLPSESVLDVNASNEIIARERTGMITGSYLKIYSDYDAMKKGYKINYGEERMRGLQGTGGIHMTIDMTCSEISKKLTM